MFRPRTYALKNGKEHPDTKKVARSSLDTSVPHLCISAKVDLCYEDHHIDGYARVLINNAPGEQGMNKSTKNRRVVDVMLTHGTQSSVFKLYTSFFAHGLIKDWTTTKMTVIEKMIKEVFDK